MILELLLVSSMISADLPKAKIPVGKDTTFVDAPLDAKGYPDYVKYYNQTRGKGVTASNNAAVVLIEIFGPGKLSQDSLKLLGVTELDPTAKRFQRWNEFVNEKYPDDEEKRQSVHLMSILDKPWKKDERPELAEWLDLNQVVVAKIREDYERPHFFLPQEPGRLNFYKSSFFSEIIELQRYHHCRVLHQLAENKSKAAWEGILDSYRLARLAERLDTHLDNSPIPIAIRMIAHGLTTQYLVRVNLDEKELKLHWCQIKEIEHKRSVVDSVDQIERLILLDQIKPELILRHATKTNFITREFVENKCDWSRGYQWTNQVVTAWVEVLKAKDAAEFRIRVKEFHQRFDLKSELTDAVDLNSLILRRAKEPEKVVLAVCQKNVEYLFDPEMRLEELDRITSDNLLEVVFALEKYRLVHKTYPNKLDDLVPKQLAAIPLDLRSGKTVCYRLQKDGFRVYSVGQNGLDNEGRIQPGNKNADDRILSVTRP